MLKTQNISWGLAHLRRWKFDGNEVRRLRLTFLPPPPTFSFLSFSDNALLLVRRALALLRDPRRSETRRKESDGGRIRHQNAVTEEEKR